MLSFLLLRSFFTLILGLLTSAKLTDQSPKFASCKGGSVYFTAHPSDSLLYQQPDLFHDFYVYKCVTSVVFTSGDRGFSGNFSQSLENGLEAAYAYMAGAPTNGTAWENTTMQINNYNLTMRFLKNTPQVQILYLRLPDGASDGQGHDLNHSQSLKKLYEGNAESISTIDGKSTYTLHSLTDLIAALLKQYAPRDIRVLDFRSPVPKDGEFDGEHADHAITARLVVDVVEKEKIVGEVRGYAGSFMLKLDATLNATNSDFFIKADTFFEYAKHDEHVCKTHAECFEEASNSSAADVSQDVKHVVNFLDREYYVS